jgi:hypothetical protein
MNCLQIVCIVGYQMWINQHKLKNKKLSDFWISDFGKYAWGEFWRTFSIFYFHFLLCILVASLPFDYDVCFFIQTETYTSPQNRTNNSKNPNSLSKVVRSIQRDFCFCNPIIFVIWSIRFSSGFVQKNILEIKLKNKTYKRGNQRNQKLKL